MPPAIAAYNMQSQPNLREYVPVTLRDCRAEFNDIKARHGPELDFMCQEFSRLERELVPDDSSNQAAVSRHGRLVYFNQHLVQTTAQLREIERVLADADAVGGGSGGAAAHPDPNQWAGHLSRLKALRVHVEESLLPIKSRLQAQLYGAGLVEPAAPHAATPAHPASALAASLPGKSPLGQAAHPATGPGHEAPQATPPALRGRDCGGGGRPQPPLSGGASAHAPGASAPSQPAAAARRDAAPPPSTGLGVGEDPTAVDAADLLVPDFEALQGGGGGGVGKRKASSVARQPPQPPPPTGSASGLDGLGGGSGSFGGGSGALPPRLNSFDGLEEWEVAAAAAELGMEGRPIHTHEAGGGGFGGGGGGKHPSSHQHPRQQRPPASDDAFGVMAGLDAGLGGGGGAGGGGQGRHDAKRARSEGGEAGASSASGGSPSEKGAAGSSESAPKAVEYQCSVCAESYASLSHLNPWWALTREACPKCLKMQIPRIDIHDPANTIEYHPALIRATQGEGGDGDDEDEDTGSGATGNHCGDGGEGGGGGGGVGDDGFDGEGGGVSGAEDEDDPDKEGDGAGMPHRLPTSQAAKLLVLIAHARTCPGHHQSRSHSEVCKSVKYLMLHIRDCCGKMPDGGQCGFPWCKPCKYLIHHLVKCHKPDTCQICSPWDLPPALSKLRKLNQLRDQSVAKSIIG